MIITNLRVPFSCLLFVREFRIEFTAFDGEVHPFLGEFPEFAVVGELTLDLRELVGRDVLGVTFAEVGVA